MARVSDIFQRLPFEMVRECLMRVPFSSHCNLRAVCKSWKDALSSPQFYRDREKSGLAEEFLIIVDAVSIFSCRGGCKIIMYDPRSNSCRKLPPLPAKSEQHCCNAVSHSFSMKYKLKSEQYCSGGFSHCVSVNYKLIVMGLLNLDNYGNTTAADTIFIYSACSSKWVPGTKMPRARRLFTCAADSAKGLVFVAGGLEENDNELLEATVYSVDEVRWDPLPPMNAPAHNCRSAFIDGKFLVLSSHEWHAQIYYTETRVWTLVNYSTGLEPLPWLSPGSYPCVAAFGKLYSFDYETLANLDFSENEMIRDGGGGHRFPSSLENTKCATVWLGKIFVSGYDSDGLTVFYFFDPVTSGGGRWIPVRMLRVEGYVYTTGYVYSAADYPCNVYSVATLKV